MTSRATNGRSSGELPISRSVSTQEIAALRSSGCDSALASIRIGSVGSGTRQPQPTATLGVRRGAKQDPTILRQAIFCDVFGRGLPEWS